MAYPYKMVQCLCWSKRVLRKGLLSLAQDFMVQLKVVPVLPSFF